ALDGYPRHAGLTANGVLLRRHSKPIRQLGEQWWREIHQGSWRDQLSLGYVAWKLGLRYALLDSNCWDGPLFEYRHRQVLGANDQLPADRAQAATLHAAET